MRFPRLLILALDARQLNQNDACRARRHPDPRLKPGTIQLLPIFKFRPIQFPPTMHRLSLSILRISPRIRHRLPNELLLIVVAWDLIIFLMCSYQMRCLTFLHTRRSIGKSTVPITAILISISKQ